MILGDAVGDAQAEPRAARFETRREEGVQDVREVAGLNALTVVADDVVILDLGDSE